MKTCQSNTLYWLYNGDKFEVWNTLLLLDSISLTFIYLISLFYEGMFIIYVHYLYCISCKNWNACYCFFKHLTVKLIIDIAFCELAVLCEVYLMMKRFPELVEALIISMFHSYKIYSPSFIRTHCCNFLNLFC